MNVSLLIALWGAALSTVLATVKLWEIRRDRFRIDVGYNFSGAPDGANKVIVRNLGTRPFILGYWELLWLPHRWAPKHNARSISPEEDADDSVRRPRARSLRARIDHVTRLLEHVDEHVFFERR